MNTRVLHIATNTFREAVRDRVLYNLIAFALLLTGAAVLVGQISIDIEKLVVINLGLTAVKKNPALGEFQMLHQPRIQLPTCMGVRKEANKDWRDFLNAWVDYNRGIQQIREWLYGGLAINGVKPEDIPADVEL